MTSLVPTRFEQLNQRFNKICYLNEENSLVNINIIGENFYPSQLKETIGEFLEFIIYMSLKALEKAKRYNSKQYDIHIHLENCGPKNLNIRMFKYIYTEVCKVFEDTTHKIYVYSNSNFCIMAFKLIKNFLERETIRKLEFVNSKNYSPS